MRAMTSTEDIYRRMRELIATREAAARPLAEILARQLDLQEQLAKIAEPYAKAYKAATAAGWSSQELAAIGAEEPERRPPGRPRKRPPRNTEARPEPPVERPSGLPVQGVPGRENVQRTTPGP